MEGKHFYAQDRKISEIFLKFGLNGDFLKDFIKSKHRYQNVIKLAIQESSQNVSMTNGLVTGGIQKKPFRYDTM